MVVSFEHRFIFLKTIKTAGTSFEIALSKYLGPSDIITPVSEEYIREELGYRGAQNYKQHSLLQKLGLLKIKPRYYNHMTAEEVRRRIGKEIFDRHLKISIIRNPYDHVVSRYFWDNKDKINETSKSGFKNWLITIKLNKLMANGKITQINGKNVIDFMIRFEHFETDINSLAERLGLPNSLYTEFNSITAKSQIRPKTATVQEMFDGFSEGIDLVEQLFHEDIEKYGYKIS